ncbi:DUF7344 domain-containing protein [Halovenus sp. HT40]|uniref:DUF7344 domain-containing protein n=1 Tax=Halovenus sp. HT40 TaxID=3126691 RepID=UPI00300F6A5C
MTEPDGELTEGGVSEVTHEFASDEFYRVLASTVRRRVLFSLLNNEQFSTEELAELLYGWESTTGEGATYEQIHTELHHVHLPRLAASNLVEFEPETGTVTQVELPEAVRAVVRHSIEAEQHERPRDA